MENNREVICIINRVLQQQNAHGRKNILVDVECVLSFEKYISCVSGALSF